ISPRFLELIEIGFLLDRFQYVPILVQTSFIVFVRGIGAPVSSGGVYFPAHYFTATKTGRDQIIELPRSIIPSKDHNRGLFWRYEFCGKIGVRSAPPIGNIQGIAQGR